jgi:hypothetical protein
MTDELLYPVLKPCARCKLYFYKEELHHHWKRKKGATLYSKIFSCVSCCWNAGSRK